MRANKVTVTSTPTSLLTLLDIPEGQRGSWSIKFQSPAANTADIFWGDKNQQPMLLAATGVTEEVIPGTSLKDLYFVAASDQILNVVVWQ